MAEDLIASMMSQALDSFTHGASQFSIEAIDGALSFDEQLHDRNLTRSDLRRMLYADSELSAAFQIRLGGLTATPFRFQHDGSMESLHIEDRLTRAMRSIITGWYESIQFGYSVQAIKWLLSETPSQEREQGFVFQPLLVDGFITFNQIASKPIEKFIPAIDGGLCNATDPEQLKGTLDCQRVYMLTVNQFTEKNPYGHSLLADLHKDWYDRSACLGFQMFALDRFSDPLIWGKVERPEEFKKQMVNLRINRYFTVGKDDTVELLINPINDQCSAIAAEKVESYNRVILSGTLTSIAGTGGSLAQSKTHEDNKQTTYESDLAGIKDLVCRIVDAFWLVNKLTSEKPNFFIGNKKSIDFDQVKLDETMVNTHQVKFSKDYLTATYGYTDKDFEMMAALPVEVQAGLQTIGALPNLGNEPIDEE